MLQIHDSCRSIFFVPKAGSVIFRTNVGSNVVNRLLVGLSRCSIMLCLREIVPPTVFATYGFGETGESSDLMVLLPPNSFALCVSEIC